VIKFTEVPLGTNWVPLSGTWRQQGLEVVHDPPVGKTETFNFYLNDTTITDGAVEATIRVLRGGDNSGRLVFRHTPRGCYYAGVGGHGRQFAIYRFSDPTFPVHGSTALALRGDAADVAFDTPYRVRVEFVGPKITLLISDIPVLEATDDYFSVGKIGYETFANTVAKFSDLKAFEYPPISRLVDILNDFPSLVKRDYAYRQKELHDERDVQRILWTALRACYPDLVDEETLQTFGLKQYKLDFGIPSLRTIIEVKVIRDGRDTKKVQEDLMVDSIGYFANPGAAYRYLVPFVYNKANVAIDSAFGNDLLRLSPVAAVVVVDGVRPPAP
jgi:hypothetical protein